MSQIHVTFKLETDDDGQALTLRINGSFICNWSCLQAEDIEKRKAQLLPQVYQQIFEYGQRHRAQAIKALLS